MTSVDVGQIIDVYRCNTGNRFGNSILCSAYDGHRRLHLGIRRRLRDARVHTARQDEWCVPGGVTVSQGTDEITEVAFVMMCELSVDGVVDALVPSETADPHGVSLIP